METLEVGDLQAVLSQRPGLIVGPGVSLYPGVIAEIVKHLGESEATLPFQRATVAPDVLLSRLRTFLADKSAGVGVQELGAVTWSAVMTLCPDAFVEDAIKGQQQGKVNSRTVDVLDEDLRRPPTARALPVFRLLGSAIAGTFVFSQPQFYKRKAQWPAAVHTFRDATKAGPIVCLGLAEFPTITMDLFSYFLADRLGPARKIILLYEDPLTAYQPLQDLLAEHSAFFKAHATIGEFSRAARERYIVRPNSTQPAATSKWPLLNLATFSHLAVSVNAAAMVPVDRKVSNRLLDLLFAPHSSSWEPFSADLDLRRSLETAIVGDVEREIETGRLPMCSGILVGGAASGKTTLLKRVAHQLATKGHATIWLKPSLHPDNQSVLRDLFKKAAGSRPKGKVPLIVCIDDPPSFGTVIARQVAIAAEQISLPVIVLVAVRQSEWDPRAPGEITGGMPVLSEWRLDDSLTEDEWRRLPEQLVRMGLAQTTETAEKMVLAAENQYARDTLGMLYVLAPKARSVIKGAIREEYLRLGSPKTLSSVVANLASTASTPLRQAYEIVAVCSAYAVPVPVEILVSTLGINYDVWLKEASPDGPAWGIFYPVDDDEEDGEDAAVYRTRNSVVEDTVLEALNGGALGHSGEVRVLRDVLSHCTGHHIVYREFCLRLLTSDRFQYLTFEDGLVLFDAALGALPFPDKTLVHRKGIWIRKRGKDPVSAKKVFFEALATSNYPNSTRSEADEHIYTSLAASTVDEVKRHLVGAKEARQEIFDYLTKARSEHFFNPNAVHVAAEAVREYIQQLGKDAAGDTLQLANHVLADLDSTLFVFGATTRSPIQDSDAHMLEEARDRLMAVVNSEVDLVKMAEDLWTVHQSQEGFSVLLRRLLYDAIGSKKGEDFKTAWESGENIIRRIEAAKRTPIPNITRTMTHLLYQWRVRRAIPGHSDLKNEWIKLETLARATLRGVQAGSDPATRYILALALAQQGKWAEARGAFAEIRGSGVPTSLFSTGRDYLVYDTGVKRRVQGVVRAGSREDYIESREPRWDFPLAKRDTWPDPGNEAFGFVRFAYSGMLAVKDNEG